jgi:hypothetical protein
VASGDLSLDKTLADYLPSMVGRIEYYSIARYHKDIDTVVIQFVNTVGDNTITLTDVVYGRIIRILRKRDGKT